MLKRENDVISTTRKYAHSIMSLTRAGLDRSKVARILWETCALPAILYGTEPMSLSKNTVKKIESFQTAIGNFIRQVSSSTSKVSTWTEAGLMPIKFRIWTRKACYYWKMVNRKKDKILEGCLEELINQGEEDDWMKEILEIEKSISEKIPNLSLKKLKEAISDAAVRFVLEGKQEHRYLQAQPQPGEWFTLQRHINDSRDSKILCMARSVKMMLGNRMKNRFGKQWKNCPWCEQQGVTEQLEEAHVILNCPVVEQDRDRLNINKFRQQNHRVRTRIILRRYLGQDGANRAELRNRARAIHQIVERMLIRVQHL